jgi:SAM-dependent methyltransferase
MNDKTSGETSGGTNSNQFLAAKEAEDLNSIFFDQYSRYKATAEIVEKLSSSHSVSILDVGSGESCLLGKFLPRHDVTYVDPLLEKHEAASEKMIGGHVFTTRLDGRTFDYVICIDTLEHVPADVRASFLERLSALARKGVIIACPCANGGQAEEADSYINRVYQAVFARDYSWLDEHSRYGLPDSHFVSGFFEGKGWFVSCKQNAHLPWLKELLSYVVCANEIPALSSVIDKISSMFNDNLYQYDGLPPAYRQIFIATKEAFTMDDKVVGELPGNVEGVLFEIRKEIFGSLFKYCLEKDEAAGDSHQELMKISDWASKIAADVKSRDREIIRLNELLKQMTEWGKKASQEVEEKNAVIDKLNKTIEDLRKEYSKA